MMHASHGARFSTAVSTIVLSCLFTLSIPALAQAKTDLPRLSAANSKVVIAELEPELQDFVNRQKRLPGQGTQVLVKVSPDPDAGVIWIDLDESYLPKGSSSLSDELASSVNQIESQGYELIGDVVGFRYIRARIGGKTLNEIFPPEYTKRRKSSGRIVTPPFPAVAKMELRSHRQLTRHRSVESHRWCDATKRHVRADRRIAGPSAEPAVTSTAAQHQRMPAS